MILTCLLQNVSSCFTSTCQNTSTIPRSHRDSSSSNYHLNVPTFKAQLMTAILYCRYMERRCKFLDNLPAFNYNTGAGEYMKDKQSETKIVTNTKQLGSTLMRTMLDEVSDFCDPAIKDNWSKKPHQQVM